MKGSEKKSVITVCGRTYKRGTFSVKNGILKGKGLYLGVERPV